MYRKQDNCTSIQQKALTKLSVVQRVVVT